VADSDVGPLDERRQPGVRDAVVVGGILVDVVLVTAAVSLALPTPLRDIVTNTPALILVLVIGTIAVLWRVARGSGPL
jgi:hypothetical protein